MLIDPHLKITNKGDTALEIFPVDNSTTPVFILRGGHHNQSCHLLHPGAMIVALGVVGNLLRQNVETLMRVTSSVHCP